MKIKRNTDSLQNQLAKMLQAGKENVDNSSDNEQVTEGSSDVRLHANTQISAPTTLQEQPVQEQPATAPKHLREAAASRTREKKRVEEAPKLNAAQRHEVPDRNAKFAGEPIKSVGCRMPQSLYARMLQYKALNDSQLNRITLNDIIIEAVDKFLGK